VKVWLDDARDAPSGWVRARTPEEVIELLRLGEIVELSLDHDLGLDDGVSERTGYAVLRWLEEEVGTGRWSAMAVTSPLSTSAASRYARDGS
jgi:NAD+-processing family protein with receiver domain